MTASWKRTKPRLSELEQFKLKFPAIADMLREEGARAELERIMEKRYQASGTPQYQVSLLVH